MLGMAAVFEHRPPTPSMMLRRRVGVRTLPPLPMCNQPSECLATTTYFVWAGDHPRVAGRSIISNEPSPFRPVA
jgi:hypothetical protein